MLAQPSDKRKADIPVYAPDQDPAVSGPGGCRLWQLPQLLVLSAFWKPTITQWHQDSELSEAHHHTQSHHKLRTWSFLKPTMTHSHIINWLQKESTVNLIGVLKSYNLTGVLKSHNLSGVLKSHSHITRLTHNKQAAWSIELGSGTLWSLPSCTHIINCSCKDSTVKEN